MLYHLQRNLRIVPALRQKVFAAGQIADDHACEIHDAGEAVPGESWPIDDAAIFIYDGKEMAHGLWAPFQAKPWYAVCIVKQL